VDDLHRLLANWSFGKALSLQVIRGGQTVQLTTVPTEGAEAGARRADSR
jgi:hypothetical protein